MITTKDDDKEEDEDSVKQNKNNSPIVHIIMTWTSNNHTYIFKYLWWPSG